MLNVSPCFFSFMSALDLVSFLFRHETRSGPRLWGLNTSCGPSFYVIGKALLGAQENTTVISFLEAYFYVYRMHFKAAPDLFVMLDSGPSRCTSNSLEYHFQIKRPQLSSNSLIRLQKLG